MTVLPCTCDHALPAHYLWDGCSAEFCDCTYRYVPTSSDQARAAALEATRSAIRDAKVKGGRL